MFTFTKILPLIALVIGGTILIRFVRNVPERQADILFPKKFILID
jgi:hypothetical protein